MRQVLATSRMDWSFGRVQDSVNVEIGIDDRNNNQHADANEPYFVTAVIPRRTASGTVNNRVEIRGSQRQALLHDFGLVERSRNIRDVPSIRELENYIGAFSRFLSNVRSEVGRSEPDSIAPNGDISWSTAPIGRDQQWQTYQTLQAMLSNPSLTDYLDRDQILDYSKVFAHSLLDEAERTYISILEFHEHGVVPHFPLKIQGMRTLLSRAQTLLENIQAYYRYPTPSQLLDVQSLRARINQATINLRSPQLQDAQRNYDLSAALDNAGQEFNDGFYRSSRDSAESCRHFDRIDVLIEEASRRYGAELPRWASEHIQSLRSQVRLNSNCARSPSAHD